MPKGSWMKREATGSDGKAGVVKYWRALKVCSCSPYAVVIKWSNSKVSVKSIIPGSCKAGPAVSVPPGVCPELRTIKKKIGAGYRDIFMAVDESSVVEAESLNFENRGLRNCRWNSLNTVTELAHFSEGLANLTGTQLSFEKRTAEKDETQRAMTMYTEDAGWGEGQLAPPLHWEAHGSPSNERALFHWMHVSTLLSNLFFKNCFWRGLFLKSLLNSLQIASVWCFGFFLVPRHVES